MRVNMQGKPGRYNAPYSGVPTFLRQDYCDDIETMDADIAMAANKEGRYDVAARTFDEANRMYPHVTLTWNAARAYHNGGELEAARDRYRTCLTIDALPTDKREQALNYLVEVEIALRKAEEAPPTPRPPSPPADEDIKPPATGSESEEAGEASTASQPNAHPSRSSGSNRG